MATATRIELLPARLGDCILVECARDAGRPWRMLVDGGPPDTWPALEARLKELDDADGETDDVLLDVVVITHIDSDHIGGMIPFFDSAYATRVGDVWFNGRTHLPDAGGTRSVSQGESVVTALLGAPTGRVLPWNRAFGSGPIDTGDAGNSIEVLVEGGPLVTKRLTALSRLWFETVEAARRGVEQESAPDDLPPLDDLAAIAASTKVKDTSVPNGSSIALLIEHRGSSVVLGADAFGSVLGAGLSGVAEARGLDSLSVDAFKLPHHGSKANVLEAMVKTAPAEHYLVSTNGDTFHHPDDAALARVVLAGTSASPALWFNYRTARTARWEDPRLQQRYGYTTHFPDGVGGIVLELPAKP